MTHDSGSDGAGRGQEGGKEALGDDPGTLGRPDVWPGTTSLGLKIAGQLAEATARPLDEALLMGDDRRLTDARVDRQVDLAFKVVAANTARDAALAERDQLAARLARVAALHLLDQEEEGFCEGCQEDWPCPTRAILDPADDGPVR
jgi:hypothetical protein